MLGFQICLTGKQLAKREDGLAERYWVFRQQHRALNIVVRCFPLQIKVVPYDPYYTQLHQRSIQNISGGSKKTLIEAVLGNQRNIEMEILFTHQLVIIICHFALFSAYESEQELKHDFFREVFPNLQVSRKRNKSTPILTCLVVRIESRNS